MPQLASSLVALFGTQRYASDTSALPGLDGMSMYVTTTQTHNFPCAGADIDEAVILRNFHEQEPGLYRANKREQDGLYESTHVRSIRDPYFSVSWCM